MSFDRPTNISRELTVVEINNSYDNVMYFETNLTKCNSHAKFQGNL